MSAVLISDEYRKQQEALHENPNYGVASVQYAPIVSEICNKLEVQHLLDYGAGKCRLFQNIKVGHKMKLQAYDPGVPRLSTPPVPAEMVACIDVLEHIEPELLDNVLDDLARLTEAVCFLTVHTGPAVKVLPDGRNAHLTQQPLEWWLPKFWERFDIQTVQVTGEHGFYVIAYAKPHLIETE
jgi:hypothetical protein